MSREDRFIYKARNRDSKYRNKKKKGITPPQIILGQARQEALAKKREEAPLSAPASE